MGCNVSASPNLHGAAFLPCLPCGILPDMERKHKNYVKQWRQEKGLTQKQLLSRLVELAGDQLPDDPSLRIPTTEASLSRIENGKQNFSIATLEALADALDVDEPGWLLSRNPAKDGEVVFLSDYKLDAEQTKQARAVLDAMFGGGRGK